MCCILTMSFETAVVWLSICSVAANSGFHSRFRFQLIALIYSSIKHIETYVKSYTMHQCKVITSQEE